MIDVVTTTIYNPLHRNNKMEVRRRMNVCKSTALSTVHVFLILFSFWLLNELGKSSQEKKCKIESGKMFQIHLRNCSHNNNDNRIYSEDV